MRPQPRYDPAWGTVVRPPFHGCGPARQHRLVDRAAAQRQPLHDLQYVPELGGPDDNAAPALDAVPAALPEDPRPPPDVTKYDDLPPSRRPPAGGR
jgi:hypothetical protein